MPATKMPKASADLKCSQVKLLLRVEENGIARQSHEKGKGEEKESRDMVVLAFSWAEGLHHVKATFQNTANIKRSSVYESRKPTVLLHLLVTSLTLTPIVIAATEFKW